MSIERPFCERTVRERKRKDLDTKVVGNSTAH